MTSVSQSSWSIGQCVSLACLLEAIAPKPGNVHRGADFEDLTLTDLAVSGVAIAPAMELAAGRPLGETVLAAVQATRHAVATNANLGIVLLFAPLAAVARDVQLATGVKQVLAGLTAADAANVYAAIRLAQPGGMGKVEEDDVQGSPPDDLLAAMQAAAERDLVARQYANGFEQVLGEGLPSIVSETSIGRTLGEALVLTHLRLMARYPDSLIARKCGPAVAQQAADGAADILKSGQPGDGVFQALLADFDFWLRSDGHRRNPGTTADLVAASLLAALRDGLIHPPFRM